MIAHMVMEFTIMLRGVNMKESGMKIKSMDMERKVLLRVMSMKVILSME
jgi:hypothetical protein